jgi:hypothetical protein
VGQLGFALLADPRDMGECAFVQSTVEELIGFAMNNSIEPDGRFP